MVFGRDGIEADVAAAADEVLARAWDREAWTGGLPPVWKPAAETGWFDLLISESDGGLGLGPAAAAAVAERVGYRLMAGPVVDTMVGSAALGRSGNVISFLGGSVEIANGHASADTLHGDWADEADILLAAVGDVVIAVDRDAPGIVVQHLDSIDRCRQPATVRLDRAPIMASFPDASRTVGGLRLALTAAEMLGVTQRALEISRTYAEERHQFGVAIATFQAVRHRLARMAVGVESLRSACYLAQIALAGDRDAGDPVLLAMVAKAHAASTGREILEDALQVHGGVGFTAEHELSALFARALSLQGAVSDERDLTRAIALHALDKRRGAA